MKKKIPQLFLEQKALGELDEKHEKYFIDDPELLDAAAGLKKDNEDILNKYPPGEMADMIRRRAREEGIKNSEESVESEGHSRIIDFIKSPAPLLAAAALAILIGVVPVIRGIQGGNSEIIEGNRLKGLKPSLTVFRETQNGIEALREGDLVAQDDLLQIEYNAGNFPYGVLLSVDGRGVVTLHYPATEYGPQELERGAESMIPYAYQLDDAPEFERFFFIFSNSMLEIDTIIDRAETLADSKEIKDTGSLLDDPDVYEASVLLLKE